ncbi:MAG: hypothetical protein ACNA8W_07920, partial [Bradymonadaceae bacterium]
MNDERLLNELGEEEKRQLEENNFDRQTFLELRRRFLEGELTPEHNRIVGEVLPPEAEELPVLPARGSERGRALDAL